MSSTPNTPRSSNPTPEGPAGGTASTDAAAGGLTGAAAEKRFLEAVEQRLAQQASHDSAPDRDQSRLEVDEESLVQVDNPE